MDAHARSQGAILTWSAPASTIPLTGYQVITYQFVNQQWQVFASARVSHVLSTLAIVDGLTDGYPYRFTVRGANASGWGPESTPSRVIYPSTALPANPGGVTPLSGDGSATLLWTARAGTATDHYLVLIYLSGGGLVQYLDGIPGYATQATISGLVNGTSYMAEIHTMDSAGRMSSGVQVQMIPGLNLAPSAPSNLRVTLGDRSATLSWDSPASSSVLIDHYAVSLAQGSILVWTNQTVFAGSVTIPSLQPGQSYLAEVRSVSARGVLGSPVSLSFTAQHLTGNFLFQGKITGLILRNHRAYFLGTGTMNGVANHRFAVAVADDTALGGSARLALWVTDPNHALINHCTFAATTLSSGSMTVSMK